MALSEITDDWKTVGIGGYTELSTVLKYRTSTYSYRNGTRLRVEYKLTTFNGIVFEETLDNIDKDTPISDILNYIILKTGLSMQFGHNDAMDELRRLAYVNKHDVPDDVDIDDYLEEHADDIDAIDFSEQLQGI